MDLDMPIMGGLEVYNINNWGNINFGVVNDWLRIELHTYYRMYSTWWQRNIR
jgi:hypothetical protein